SRGESLRKPCIEFRKLCTTMAIVTGPGFIGALTGKGNFDFAVGKQTYKIESCRTLVPNRLFNVAEIPVIVFPVVFRTNCHLRVICSISFGQDTRIMRFIRAFPVLKTNSERMNGSIGLLTHE